MYRMVLTSLQINVEQVLSFRESVYILEVYFR